MILQLLQKKQQQQHSHVIIGKITKRGFPCTQVSTQGNSYIREIYLPLTTKQYALFL